MPVYHNLKAIEAAYASSAGVAQNNWVALHGDTAIALELANLRVGESVLELGAGSGDLITKARGVVQTGCCVAVDGCRGFTLIDIPNSLNRRGLHVSPAGNSTTQVHVIHANVTDGGLRSKIAALPNVPSNGFDCIFAVHLFNQIRGSEREQTLRTIKKLCASGGRIVLNTPGLFRTLPTRPEDAGRPVLFRSCEDYYTEAPGAVLCVAYDGRRLIPTIHSNQPTAHKTVEAAVQVLPARFWAVAAGQLKEAAARVGLEVADQRKIGDGGAHGFARGTQSPTHSDIAPMRRGPLLNRCHAALATGRWACVGAMMHRIATMDAPTQGISQERQDGNAVVGVQGLVKSWVERISANGPQHGHITLHGEFLQVGIMGLLRKKT